MVLSSGFFLWFIFIGSATLMLIVIFFFLLFVQYNRKKNDHIREKEALQRTYEKALLQSQLEIQEATFNQISGEIHDNIGQALSLVRLQLNTLGAGANEAKVNSADELLGKAIGDLRSLSHSLNTKYLVETGLANVIQQQLAYLERSGRFKTSFKDNSDGMEIAEEKSIFLLRMIQEIINNILKHAAATEVSVAISGEKGQYSIAVSDNGIGFQQNEKQGKGIGITGLHKRAELIGATIQFNSIPQKGTTVFINLT